MKFVVAMMKHETNTFSPLPTSLSSFGRTGGHDGPFYGPEVIEVYAGTNNPIAAYLDLAREEGAEVLTPIAAEAWPSGAGRGRHLRSDRQHHMRFRRGGLRCALPRPPRRHGDGALRRSRGQSPAPRPYRCPRPAHCRRARLSRQPECCDHREFDCDHRLSDLSARRYVRGRRGAPRGRCCGHSGARCNRCWPGDLYRCSHTCCARRRRASR